jgi:hypothetical protein
MRLITTFALAAGLYWPAQAPAQGPTGAPKPVPITRQEMKQALEALKKASPRLPLPPLTEKETGPSGKRQVNNGRMRQFYLPPELRGGGFAKAPDQAMTLPYEFKTMLFWIVSRTNNCYY